MIKTLGYILFAICTVSFLSILVVPLLGFTGKQVAKITVALVVIGEVTFYLSLLLLGKTFFEKIRSKLKFRKSRSDKNNEPEK